MELKDVQNEKSKVSLELHKAGIEGLKKYIIIKRPNITYHNIVEINSYVNLPSDQRGAHMSRFVEAAENIPEEIDSIEGLAETLAKNVLEKHGHHCYTEVSANLPFQKKRFDGKLETAIAKMNSSFHTKTNKKTLGISVIGALACPCSKEMCGGLTHNQRSEIKIEFDVSKKNIELFDVAEIANQCFSSPVFSKLKRVEEKKVVENMHNNPMFVEDTVRKCVSLLKDKYLGMWTKVKCVSFESIHEHNAVSEWEGVL